MRMNPKMMTVAALLAVSMMMTGCGASGSTAGSVASSAAASAPASSVAASSEVQNDGAVEPIVVTKSLDALKSDSYKLSANLTKAEDGQLTMTVYQYDAYEKADIEGLEVGDVIRTHDQMTGELVDMTVETLEKDEDQGAVTINGGIEEGGMELWIDHDVYRTVTFDDYPVYYEAGEVTLPLAENVSLSDTSAEPGAEAVMAEGVEEVEKAIAADPDNWTCNNTTVFTEDGKVTGILRIWVP